MPPGRAASPARRRCCTARIRFGRSDLCHRRFGSVAGTCTPIQCRSVRPQEPSKRNWHYCGGLDGMTLVFQGLLRSEPRKSTIPGLNRRNLVKHGFREKKPGRYGLTVIDRGLPAFDFTVPKNGAKTFFVRGRAPRRCPEDHPRHCRRQDRRRGEGEGSCRHHRSQDRPRGRAAVRRLRSRLHAAAKDGTGSCPRGRATLT